MLDKERTKRQVVSCDKRTLNVNTKNWVWLQCAELDCTINYFQPMLVQSIMLY
jgi:hypothetical protein